MCAIYVVLVIIKTVTLGKNLTREYAAVPVVLGSLLLATIIRTYYPGITIIPFVVALSNLVILLTFENPDAKMLKLAETAKNMAIKADQVKDNFLSLASHQLRTPLTSIRGYASMVVEGDFGAISKEQAHAIQEIVNSSHRMAILVEDLLNVSRLQSGKFVLAKTSVNLGSLIKTEIDQVTSIADSRNVKIIYHDQDYSKIPPVSADATKIGEVMSNMIDNAIFYSRSGKTVEVSLKYNETHHGVEFRVHDHGIGVPKADQADLFTKFFRASNARTIRPDGTGIGLFLAQKIVKEHGGGIIFSSTEGQGSTFGFWLPAVMAEARTEVAHNE
jgi:signal transduction histidine kinase